MLDLHNNLFNELLAEKQGVELINWEERRRDVKWGIEFFVAREIQFYERYNKHTVLVVTLVEKINGRGTGTATDDVNIINLGKYLEQQGFCFKHM